MGRRNLICAAAGASLALAAAAFSAAALSWRVAGDGIAPGGPVSTPAGTVLLTRAAATRLGSRVGPTGAAELARIDFTRTAVVVVFGEFGCQDKLIAVSGIVQQGSTLAVRLVRKQPAAGTAICQALYATYRILAIPRAALVRPFPTRSVVTLA